jgi:very-short-patch-repair endonuclease
MRGPDRRKVKTERRLRRQSTDAEMTLWLSLRDRRLSGFKFVRQEAIDSFIVDFICREKKLIIEVDGGQHAESERDKIRDKILQQAGYRVVRFWNSGISQNKSGVLETILSALNDR